MRAKPEQTVNTPSWWETKERIQYKNTRETQEPLVFRVLRSSRVYFPSFLPLAEIWNKKSDQKNLKPSWAYELFTGTKT